jgi:hypothetical protein
VFGAVGYWAEVWDRRAGVLLAERRAEIAARKEERAAAATACEYYHAVLRGETADVAGGAF